MSGLTAASLGAAGTEDTLVRATRLCDEALARGEGTDAGWCREMLRLAALGTTRTAPSAAVDESPEVLAALAASREQQAQAQRAATAARLVSVGVSPVIAQAARDTRDVQYVSDDDDYTWGDLVADSERTRIYGPPAPAGWTQPATDQALTQNVVARTNLSNTTSLSPQAQAARARNQFASARYSRRAIYPRPMTERQQLSTVLTAQAQAGLGTGSKVALAALVTLGILSVGSLLFGRRR